MIEPASGIWIPDGVPTVPVDRLITAPWNPNAQSDKVFRNLVDSIQENGFLELLVVAPITDVMRVTYLNESHDDGDYWLIVGGAHRKDAAVLLGMQVVPAIIKPGWSEDVIKFQNMRLNVLKGRIDPSKFFKLFQEMQGKGYADDVLKAQMGLVEEKMFKSLVKQVKDNLPKQLADQIDDDDVQNTDDLSRILNELFSKHGDTLPFGYMVFDFGGKTNFWVPMTRETKSEMDRVSGQCFTEKVDLNRVLTKLLENGAAVQAALAAAIEELDAESEEMFGDS